MQNLVKEQFQRNKKSWVKSLEYGMSRDENGDFLPWMCYPLIEYLCENLRGDEEVFEYGSGASTLFFAKRVKRVKAVETDAFWHKMMVAKLSGVDNVELILMEDGLLNEKYEKMALKKGFFWQKVPKFDLIIVDSLKRAKCMKNAILALKKSGKVILDDAERYSYRKIYDFMVGEGFSCQEFEGIAPAQLRLKKGWVFERG